MNVENILRIADAIERQSKFDKSLLGFNMSSFVADFVEDDPDYIDVSRHECETVACIAGWAVLVGEPAINAEKLKRMNVNEVVERAQKWLGLGEFEVRFLFYAHNAGCALHQIDAEWAVRVLRKLAASGEVDWPGCASNEIEVGTASAEVTR